MKDIVFVLAGVFSGLFGAMGMGGGGVLIIFLNLFTESNQKNAQGINLIFFIPIALLAIIIYQKKKLIVWKVAIPYAAFGIIGSYIGIYFTDFIDGNLLSKIFGGFIVLVGIKELLKK